MWERRFSRNRVDRLMCGMEMSDDDERIARRYEGDGGGTGGNGGNGKKEEKTFLQRKCNVEQRKTSD